MKLTDFKALTFDCYGTLIDWETGIWNALQPLVSEGHLKIAREEALMPSPSKRSARGRDAVLTLFDAARRRPPRLAKRGARIYADLNDRFGASVAAWPAFPDRPKHSPTSSGITSSSFSRMSIG